MGHISWVAYEKQKISHVVQKLESHHVTLKKLFKNKTYQAWPSKLRSDPQINQLIKQDKYELFINNQQATQVMSPIT